MFTKLFAFLFGTAAIIAPTATPIHQGVVYQGDPVAITENDRTVFFGTDLNQKVGTTTFEKFGIKKDVYITKRPREQKSLGIPQSLGGNTKASADKLVATLNDEAKILRELVSTSTKLWTQPFGFPVKNVHINDKYGYSRQTGAYEISHKGTDFRAPANTEIFAINAGQVILVQSFRNYGKTVVIDHGQGVLSLYMHLSEFRVMEEEVVNKGQTIGLSGMTGYATGPHLHLSVKIDSYSIDPMVFLNFFK
ncbi:MAG: M23 family metallopeptidase [Candidatus Pacebacteria bacterium]|nr:M23 family metallopeptidase [Candidatus Paceibacterota bacterium]